MTASLGQALYLRGSGKSASGLTTLSEPLELPISPPLGPTCPQPHPAMPADCLASQYSGFYSVLATVLKFQCILSSVKIYIIVGFMLLLLFVFVYCCNYFNFQK